jgi:hypothetical protein
MMTERDQARPSDEMVEEEEAAEEQSLDPSVAEHEREMQERSAHQKGEGRLPD